MLPGWCCIANRQIGARERRQLIPPHVRFQVPFLGPESQLKSGFACAGLLCITSTLTPGQQARSAKLFAPSKCICTRPRRAMSQTVPCSSFGRPVGLRYHVEIKPISPKVTRSYLTQNENARFTKCQNQWLHSVWFLSVCTPQAVQQQVSSYIRSPQTKTRTWGVLLTHYRFTRFHLEPVLKVELVPNCFLSILLPLTRDRQTHSMNVFVPFRRHSLNTVELRRGSKLLGWVTYVIIRRQTTSNRVVKSSPAHGHGKQTLTPSNCNKLSSHCRSDYFGSTHSVKTK